MGTEDTAQRCVNHNESSANGELAYYRRTTAINKEQMIDKGVTVWKCADVGESTTGVNESYICMTVRHWSLTVLGVALCQRERSTTTQEKSLDG